MGKSKRMMADFAKELLVTYLSRPFL